MDVNLEELDQIIDGGMRAPLSESDGEKLKAVLHTLAEQVRPRWRTTEKTRAVLPQTASSELAVEKPSPEGESVPAGHGRNGAAKFTGAHTVTVPHQTLHPGDPCPERWCESWGGRRWKQPGTKWNACAVTVVGRYSRRKNRRKRVRKSMTRQRRR